MKWVLTVSTARFETVCSQITLSSLNSPYRHFHRLQAANCCRNSRLVVDENDLKWVTNEKIYCYFQKNSIKIFVLKPPGFRKLIHSSEMLNDALMHREGFSKGLYNSTVLCACI